MIINDSLTVDVDSCPFCGKPADIKLSCLKYYCICRGCGARGPVSDTIEDAAAGWNRRHDTDENNRPRCKHRKSRQKP